MNVISERTADGALSAVPQVGLLLTYMLYLMLTKEHFLVPGISDAYYCAECTRLEKDRDGCPKIVNLGASRTDLFYERRRLGTSFPLPTRAQSFC